jgi:hypothetical protein
MKYALIILLLASSLMAQKDEDTEKREIIAGLLAQDDYQGASQRFFENQIDLARQDYQELPDSVWDEVRANLDDSDAFAEGLVEIYLDRFSLEELLAIREAYQNPAMRKWHDYGVSDEAGEDFGMMAEEAAGQMNRDIRSFLLEKNYVER